MVIGGNKSQVDDVGESMQSVFGAISSGTIFTFSCMCSMQTHLHIIYQVCYYKLCLLLVVDC